MYVTSGCSGCSACPIELICPDNCPYNYPPGNCAQSCIDACIECTDTITCSLCYPYSTTNSNTGCTCPNNYVYNSTTISCDLPYKICFNTCLSCDNYNFTGCTNCSAGYYLISNTCTQCPLGYSIINSQCVFQYSLVFDMIFNVIQGIVNDSVSNIPGITGTSSTFYPSYEQNDPIAAYDRGYYFNGISSIIRLPEFEYPAPELILAPEFSFGI